MKVGLFARALACLSALAAFLPADEVGYSMYYISDSRDNTVATSAFSMVKTLWSRTRVFLDIELDQVTVPPLDVDATSGASRPRRHAAKEFRKSRGQLIVGAEQGLGADTRLTGNYYFSQEVDYGSQAFALALTQDLFQKNTTVTLRGQYTMDSVGEILTNGALVNRFRETHQASLGVSQILSRTTLLRFGGDAFRVQGYLSDPYAGNAHPEERWRQAAWVELRQYLTGLEGALHLHYRNYWDDWDLASHTVRLKLLKYLSKDVILAPWYRYHIQSAASFYRLGETEPFHSVDYKVAAFESNTMGAELTWYLRSIGRKRKGMNFLDNASITGRYFHYFIIGEDINYPAHAAQAGLNFAF